MPRSTYTLEYRERVAAEDGTSAAVAERYGIAEHLVVAWRRKDRPKSPGREDNKAPDIKTITVQEWIAILRSREHNSCT